MFTDWQWSVGRYLIDSGYDLYVTPDHGKYRGISLYVQVKGTAKTSNKRVTALVSRNRLRTYAEAMLPVFIVRATADGHLFWTDAREWARTNSDQLEGPGSATVVFATDRRLSDREGFESYLTRLLPTVQEWVAAVTEFSERSRYEPPEWFAVFNEARSGVYDINLLAFLGTSSMTVNIGFRPNIASQPVRLIDALRPLADWCDQVVVQNSFLMELCFKGVRAPISVAQDKVEELWPFLRCLPTFPMKLEYGIEL